MEPKEDGLNHPQAPAPVPTTEAPAPPAKKQAPVPGVQTTYDVQGVRTFEVSQLNGKELIRWVCQQCGRGHGSLTAGETRCVCGAAHIVL
jgi:hypothetical protein